MTTINIQRKYSTATIECAKGYIRFHDGQIADAYEALRYEYMSDVRYWRDESLVDQHWDIVRCIRDIGRNARVLINNHGRVVFLGIILADTSAQKGNIMNTYQGAIILFLSDAHGQYIPKLFAESGMRDKVTGISEEDYTVLLDGPEHELYWDTWDSVLDTANVTDTAGNVYTLYQDGDLFLICDELMTHEQKREFLDIEVYGEDEEVVIVFDVPEWIDQDITLGQMLSISEGCCASGAYMPAVTYCTAKETMNEHGDDVLQYIEDTLGEIPAPSSGESWSGIAVHYLSMAVELWAGQIDNIEVE